MDRHLGPAAFVDLLDGTTTEAAVPHLARCAECREQLTALRTLHTEVNQTEVPEPSPLFWDHLSARVRDAVAAESIRAPWWGGGRWRALAAAGAVALVLLVLGPWMFQRAPAVPSRVADQVLAPGTRPAVAAASVADDMAADNTLEFVADLAGQVDWDAAGDAGLVQPGAAELALADMDSDERAALQRLLQDALTKGGA